MKHLFTYGPVPVGESEKVTLKETEVGEIPTAWEVNELDKVVTNTQYGLSTRAGFDGKYPMLRMNNLDDGKVLYISRLIAQV